MLNLKLLVELRARFSFNPEANLSLIAFDSTNGTLLTYSTDNVLSGYVIDGISGNLKALFHLQLATADVLPPDAVVVDMQFVPDLESIILVTKDGDIVSFNLNSREAECVGTIDSGIVAMAWSPDFELMLLATGNSTLLTMTNEWDVLSEVSLFPKRNLDSTFDVEVSDLPEGDSTPRLDSASLSWRGDGKFFVTNAKNPVTGEAVMHVFERLSVHSAVCDPSEMKGTEEQVSWRPSGNIIVSTKVTKSPSSNKHEVTFYERNGLRHYEFPLRGEEASFKVVSLSWNCDSDILSILLRSPDNTSDVLQLWTTSNYRWYLKQEFVYEPQEKVVKISWDAEDASLLRVATNKGNYFQYTFAWEYTVSQGYSPANPTFATMIDGEQILLTPFRHLVTPPPMSATSLTLPSSANNHQRRVRTISYSPFDSQSTGSHFRMLVHSSDGSLLLYSVPTSNHYFPLQNNSTKATPPNFSAPPTLLGIYTPSSSEEDFLSSSSKTLRQVELIDESTIAAVFSEVEGASPATSRDQIVRFRFSLVDSTLTITEVLRTSAPKRVLRLVNNKDTFTTLLELVDGSLFRLTSSGSFLGLSPVTFGFEGATAAPSASTLPAPCQWIATTLMGGRETVIALDKRNKLYIDGRLASSECNSFTLHNEFLLFTTLTHNLRFVRLRVPFDGNLLETKANIARSDDSIREVERGSRVLTVVPHDTRVVLQMPRGNLEGISARPLMLSTLRKLLDSSKYLEAFMHMRKHRIDMNFIHDHNPSEFFSHCRQFIQQINDVNHINLFLSCLREEDVTKTLFPNPDNQDEVRQASTGTVGETKGKVNSICQAVRKELLDINKNKFLLCILTTYVKNNPPELEEVLLVIKELRDNEAKKTNKVEIIEVATKSEEIGRPVKKVTADEALKYVIFLADVDKLYDVALGMYDFDLAAMVAQKSHKDPKEYLPFLNRLRQMETYYQRYSVDIHLEKYGKALRNLSQAGESFFAQTIDLMEKHRLYSDAVEVYAGQLDNLNVVLSSYAAHLIKQGQLEEAGMMYVRCGKDREALATFKRATDWRMALTLASKLDLPKEELQEISLELADTLKNLARFDEAAQVFLDYCNDPETAINCLVSGSYWFEALQAIFKYGKQSMVEDELHPAVLEAFETNNSMIEEKTKLFQKNSTRLQTVRTNKLLFPKLDVPDGNIDEDTMSLHSAATSIASSLGSRSSYTGSNASRSSRKSNKSRRSRKRLSSKEGGPHEEEYLVTTLKSSIPSKKFIDQDIGQLLRILVFFGHFEEAKKLQKNLEVYITTVDSALVPLLTSEREINTPVGQQHPPFPTHLIDASSQWKLNILTSTTTTNSSASTSTFTH